MGYTIIDILDKAILIQNRQIDIFTDIINENNNINIVKVLSKILINKSRKTINYYENLKNSAVSLNIEEIDIMTYDKISFLINEFNTRIYVTSISNAKEYLKFTCNLLKDVYSLFIDIQGRLINNSYPKSGITYNILSEIILDLNQQIKDVENTLYT